MSSYWWHCWGSTKDGNGRKPTSKMNLRFIKLELYRYLVEPKSSWHILYHLTVFGFVLLSLCLNAVLTLKNGEGRNISLVNIVFVMELLLSVYFSLELILRLWAAGALGQYQGFYGRVWFMMQLTCIIDVLILAATVILLIADDKQYESNITGAMLRNLRFLQILRLLHVDRRATTWKLIAKVLQLHKTELIAASYLALLGLLLMSSLVYIAEVYYAESKPEYESVFGTFGDALWWGVVTLTTIGYGDIVPRWWLSKLITSVFAIVCVSLFMLTSSIIGVSLALMVQGKSTKKYLKKQELNAAVVIQSFWRQHMLAKDFDKISYYKYNLTQKLIAHELTPYTQESGGSQEINGKTIKAKKATTMFTFVDVIRRQVATAGVMAGLSLSVTNAGSTPTEPSANYRTRLKPKIGGTIPRSVSVGNLMDVESSLASQPKPTVNESTLKDIFSSPSKRFEVKIVIEPTDDANVSISVETPLVNNSNNGASLIPGRYKQALKAIWRMKFMVAKKKFKSSRKLYDLNDISDEVSHSAFAQMNRLKKVQNKVERVVGKPTISLLTDRQKELGLLQRLELVESKMAELDQKADLILQLATHLSERIVRQQKSMLNS